MNPFTELLVQICLVLLAILLAHRVIKIVRKQARASAFRQIDGMMKKYHQSVDSVEEEVRPKVDLWWNTSGRTCVERHIDAEGLPGLPNVPGLQEQMPDFMQEAMKLPVLDMAQHSAVQLAVQLATEEQFNPLLESARKRAGQEQVDKLRTEREKVIESLRGHLTTYGIDIDEFEQQFA